MYYAPDKSLHTYVALTESGGAPSTIWAATIDSSILFLFRFTPHGFLTNNHALFEDRGIHGSRGTRIIENNGLLLHRLQAQEMSTHSTCSPICGYLGPLSTSKLWKLAGTVGIRLIH